MKGSLAAFNRISDWSQVKVVVAGIGASGYAAAAALLEFGAQVLVVDDSDSSQNQEKATILEILDAQIRLGAGSSALDFPDADLVIASPGWHPDNELLQGAFCREIPIWSEVELAWRLMQPDRVVPMLAVTGTNGKTTTVNMLEAMLQAAGLQVAAVGNIGRPITEAVLDETSYDVLAVELSSFQLHWINSVSFHSAAVLNVHPDHLEWYADPAAWAGRTTSALDAYAYDKGQIYQRVQASAVYNVADPQTQALVEAADVTEGARAIGFTLGIPAVAMVGVLDDLLVDRAFITQRRDSAVELAKLEAVTPNAPHNVANALAAAALARSFGVPPQAVAQGLKNVNIGDHRIQQIAEVNGVRYVDDSKATNPHAAAASLASFDNIFWIAGGQTKGTNFDDLVTRFADRLRGVALLGEDRQVIADSLARHAPDVPVFSSDSDKNGAMREIVGWVAARAESGDVVLLAPGAASKDMYADYAERGESFTTQVRKL